MRESSVFQALFNGFGCRFRPMDQRRWRRHGWAVCPCGRFRPKLLKEMCRVAWLAKCLQSAEIRASPVKRSSVRMHRARRCASRRLGSRSFARKKCVQDPFLKTRHNQAGSGELITAYVNQPQVSPADQTALDEKMARSPRLARCPI